jgi:ubiquinone/menaquinone biosynthesis C-methylase UbiE
MDIPNFFSAYEEWSYIDALHNCRCYAVINSQVEIYKDASVLDIAGHIGQFSFAALKHGAHKVTIVEARADLIEIGQKKFEKYVPQEQYRFIQGDIHETISSFTQGEFDVVLICGFFYHTPHHLKLVEDIAKYISPRFQVYDTGLHGGSDPNMLPFVSFNKEDSANCLNAWSSTPNMVLVGSPSRSALKMMLKSTGYEFLYEFPKEQYAYWVPDSPWAKGDGATLFFEKMLKESDETESNL